SSFFDEELAPPTTLVGPGRSEGDRLEVAELDGIASLSDTGQEEDGLLDVRREHRQVHDLAQPCPGNTSPAGQIGVVADRAFSEEPLEAMRQRQQTGYTRNAAGGERLGSRPFGQLNAALAFPLDVELALDGEAVHAVSLLSWL